MSVKNECRGCGCGLRNDIYGDECEDCYASHQMGIGGSPLGFSRQRTEIQRGLNTMKLSNVREDSLDTLELVCYNYALCR